VEFHITAVHPRSSNAVRTPTAPFGVRLARGTVFGLAPYKWLRHDAVVDPARTLEELGFFPTAEVPFPPTLRPNKGWCIRRAVTFVASEPAWFTDGQLRLRCAAGARVDGAVR
jgi:hypothetical protein